jgi:CheY-like chemotaxis protein
LLKTKLFFNKLFLGDLKMENKKDCIVIADDDPVQREMYKVLVEGYLEAKSLFNNFEVITFADPANTLSFISKNKEKSKVILADGTFKDSACSGPELVRMLKEKVNCSGGAVYIGSSKLTKAEDRLVFNGACSKTIEPLESKKVVLEAALDLLIG